MTSLGIFWTPPIFILFSDLGGWTGQTCHAKLIFGATCVIHSGLDMHLGILVLDILIENPTAASVGQQGIIGLEVAY